MRPMGSRYGKKAYVNGLLIALNVLFFLYLEITGSSEDAYFMYTKGAMFAPAVLEDGEYYRLCGPCGRLGARRAALPAGGGLQDGAQVL